MYPKQLQVGRLASTAWLNVPVAYAESIKPSLSTRIVNNKQYSTLSLVFLNNSEELLVLSSIHLPNGVNLSSVSSARNLSSHLCTFFRSLVENYQNADISTQARTHNQCSDAGRRFPHILGSAFSFCSRWQLIRPHCHRPLSLASHLRSVALIMFFSPLPSVTSTSTVP
jgi:hypothetical protein